MTQQFKSQQKNGNQNLPRDDFDTLAYNPTFQWHFLAPKYWGTWLTVCLALPFSLLPHKFRYFLINKVADFLIKKKRDKGNILNVRANLAICFPEKTESEREVILKQTIMTAGMFLLGFSRVSLLNRQWLKDRCDILGMENLTNVLDAGDKVILLVPHTWAIDIPAILLASMGMPVSAMAKKQKNEVMDWLMHIQRVQYGGRVYERSGGVKPFIKSVRDGYLGYYLPDQDHGLEHSIFVDFFGNKKATLPGLGKLSKVSRAKIVPVYSRYDAETDRYTVDIHPAFEPYPTQSEEGDAREMNGFIERCAEVNPEQYMWTLRFFRTQQDGSNVYKNFREFQSNNHTPDKHESGK